MFPLILYNEYFDEYTFQTRLRARKVMYFIYGILTVCSVLVLMLVSTVTSKTLIQAGIMFLVGWTACLPGGLQSYPITMDPSGTGGLAEMKQPVIV